MPLVRAPRPARGVSDGSGCGSCHLAASSAGNGGWDVMSDCDILRLMRGWTSAVDAGSRLCDFARLEFNPVAVSFFFYY